MRAPLRLRAASGFCRGGAMSTRLFVGNLSFNTTQDVIATRFGAIGEVVNVSVMTDRETGRSRGFAFVEMASDAAAQKAIAELDGTELDGRSMRVDVAQERRSRDGGGGGGGGGGDRGAGRGGRARRHGRE
ncbi:MAG TPA: RNA-binding protein [Kofleriaceae bacterium]